MVSASSTRIRFPPVQAGGRGVEGLGFDAASHRRRGLDGLPLEQRCCHRIGRCMRYPISPLCSPPGSGG